MTSLLSAIPGLNAIYAIFNRSLDRENKILTNRQVLAKEVADNIDLWAKLLNSTFKTAIKTWTNDGRDKALAIIDELIRESIEIRYETIRTHSPILNYLDEDERFSSLASAAAAFYVSAVSAKRVVYGSIEVHSGEYISAYETDIQIMLKGWLAEIDRNLSLVRSAYDKVRTIEPR
jgi:hypothetical protein